MRPQNHVQSVKLVRSLKRSAVLGVIVGAIVVAGFVFAVLQGRAVSGPSLAFALLCAGLLVVSVYMLLPSGSRRFLQKMAAFQAMPGEERRQMLLRTTGKQLAGVLAGLSVEFVIALIFWPLLEWRGLIVAMLGTTLLASVLLIVVRVRVKLGYS